MLVPELPEEHKKGVVVPPPPEGFDVNKLRESDKGLEQNPFLKAISFEGQQEGFEQAQRESQSLAERLAERMGKAGHEKLGAALATPVSMAPEIATIPVAVASLPAAVKGAAGLVTGGVKGALSLGNFVKKAGKLAGQNIKGKLNGKEAAMKALDEVANLRTQPDLPMELPASGSSLKSDHDLFKQEHLKSAIKDPWTGEIVTGQKGNHAAMGNGIIAREQMAGQKAAQAQMESDYANWLKTAKVGDQFDMGNGNTAIFKGNGDYGNGPVPFVDLKGPNLPPNHTPAKAGGYTTLGGEALLEEKMLQAPFPKPEPLQQKINMSKGFVDAKGEYVPLDKSIERLPDDAISQQKFAQGEPFWSTKSGVAPKQPAQPTDKSIRFEPKDIREINKETRSLTEETGRPVEGTGAKLSGGEEQLPLSYKEPEPKGISFNKNDISEINKKADMSLPAPVDKPRQTLGHIEQGASTEPFIVPEPPKPMHPGAEARMEGVATTGNDIDKVHPLSSAPEIAEDVGAAKPFVRDQFQEGVKGEARAETRANEILQPFADKYHIKPESLDSALLSKYMRNPNKVEAAEVLKQHLGEKEASRFINFEKEARGKFDNWLNEVNQVRRQNGWQEITRKEDYLPQIHEYNTLSLLGQAQKAGTPEGTALVKEIETASEHLRNSKFVHLEEMVYRHLKPQGAPDIDDAITGLERYGRESERYKELQPHINELRATAARIKDTKPELAQEYLERADHIAGKIDELDDWMSRRFGKEGFRAFIEASNRMKTNVIQGNPKVPGSQLLVLPSAFGSVDLVPSVKASVKLIADPEFRQFVVANSPTIQLRLQGQASQSRYGSKIGSLLNKPSEMVDLDTLMYGFGAKYIDALKKTGNPAEAAKQAEQFVSLTQATLSKLSTAPILRSKTVQAAAPFMNQVLTQQQYVRRHMFRSLPMGEKAIRAARFAAMGVAVSAVNYMLYGDKAHSTADLDQYLPFGPAVKSGFGGTVVGAGKRILTAADTGRGRQLAKEAIRTGFLLQNKIPAGLQVSKVVEKGFDKVFPPKKAGKGSKKSGYNKDGKEE